jgi:hypothetical protein
MYVNMLIFANSINDLIIKIKNQLINEKYSDNNDIILFELTTHCYNDCASVIIDTLKKIHVLLKKVTNCKSYKYLILRSTRSTECVVNNIFEVLTTLSVDMWSLSKDIYKSNNIAFNDKYNKYKINNDVCDDVSTNSLEIIGTSLNIPYDDVSTNSLEIIGTSLNIPIETSLNIPCDDTTENILTNKKQKIN